MKELTRPESAIMMKADTNDSITPEQGPAIISMQQDKQKAMKGRAELAPKPGEKETRNAGKAAAWDRSMLFL